MKKILTLLLSISMSLLLVSCNSGTASEDPQSESTTASENVEDAESTATEIEAPNSTEIASVEESTTVTVEEEAESLVPFEETAVMDNDICSITITDLQPNGSGTFSLFTQFTNKSSGAYDFFVRAAVNNVQCSTWFRSTEFTNVLKLAAGEEAEPEVDLSDYMLSENGIGDYTDIELTFSVCEEGNWMETVYEETLHLYPYGEDKAVTYMREGQPSDNVIIDNDYVTITVTGYDAVDTSNYNINLFLDNKTDDKINLYVGKVTLNGTEASAFMGDGTGAILYPGKCTYSVIGLFGTALEEAGSDNVEEIQFQLMAYANSFDNEIINETITLNP